MRRTIDDLVEFVAHTHYDNLPVSVIDRAKLVLLDTVAAILGGSQTFEIENLTYLASQWSTAKSSTIFGYTKLADPHWASLVNATAGTSTELDEGNAYAKGHPAIHTIPAALALAEELDSTGRDVLLSIVLGYEVAARVGTACDLRNGTHPHGTWGTLGAAAAAAKLMGMDAARIRETINIASSLTLATSFQTATEGALVRNIYAGMSNQNGLLAVQLVKCGFTGEKDGVANVFGKVMSDTFNENALMDELGTRFEITRGYFKKHSCCRYNHAALDALELLRKKNTFDASVIRQVQVESYRHAAMLRDSHPTTTLAARFSVPYAVAISLVRNSTAPSAFDATALTDAKIRALAEKVQVRENPEYTAMTPTRRPARVTVELKDGRSFSETVYSSRGDPDQPFAKDELDEKYLNLSSPVIGVENAKAALSAVENFAELATVRNLTERLRGKPE